MRFIGGPTVVNDVHSRLNPTTVAGVAVPSSEHEVAAFVRGRVSAGKRWSVGGCRHSMGGQPFLSGEVLLDMRQLNRLVDFDAARGLATFQAGATWVDVQREVLARVDAQGAGLTFRQKQTGADRLTLGGAVAVNAHGRGLDFQAFVSDIESLRMVDTDGIERDLSRASDPELFSLVCGGYGLFGIVTRVTLRLVPRRKLVREVEVVDAHDLPGLFASRIADGFLYGDFQFRVDEDHPRFLRQGVFSCYRPVPFSTPMPEARGLAAEDWHRLLHLAHFDKARAFEEYARYYLSTSGRAYWSDTHQDSLYLDGYHARLDAETAAPVTGGEMISELYVPRERLGAFLDAAASYLPTVGADVIYGTVRLIKKDEEAFLTWAREDWACVIFNLHVDHCPAGVDSARTAFRGLIDLALRHGGSYFLTYHRYATRAQIEAAHPRVREFVAHKRARDPSALLSSDWYDALERTLAEGEA